MNPLNVYWTRCLHEREITRTRIVSCKCKRFVNKLALAAYTQETIQAHYRHFSSDRKVLKRWHHRTRRELRKAVKTQAFYWIVIVVVFLNSLTLALEHYGQPPFLTTFLGKNNVEKTNVSLMNVCCCTECTCISLLLVVASGKLRNKLPAREWSLLAGYKWRNFPSFEDNDRNVRVYVHYCTIFCFMFIRYGWVTWRECFFSLLFSVSNSWCSNSGLLLSTKAKNETRK